MKNEPYTYEELVEAAMTQNSTTKKIKQDLERLSFLRMLASCRRVEEAKKKFDESKEA